MNKCYLLSSIIYLIIGDMHVIHFDVDSVSCDFICDALRRSGLQVTKRTDGTNAGGIDAMLLFVGNATSTMQAMIEEVRGLYPAAPMIVIFDQDDVDVRVAAYEAGADDCLSRPFHLRELVAKLRALGRRSVTRAAAPLLPRAATAIDLVALELKIGDRKLRATKREADLLLTLSRAAGRVVTREDVLREAWGAAPGVAANLVDVYIGYVRRKLIKIDADIRIKSVRGQGFCLVAR